ncbi:MAG: ABC transporter ATP-binding protein [Planctomycetota bacterium]
MRPSIRIENLGKRYKIGLRERVNRNFREMLVDTVAAPWRRFRRWSEAASEEETIWALRDVTFDVAPGEVIGIIGRNGAGKSTLLKVLSRITEPTEGRIELCGRVASLLEVGTGFHRELTGRENIYLNAAMLGMRRGEITGRFDEIVAFAGTEKFLDTPVKHYSSGMYVRLAFAVAAHLEPEILLVDEVLAVGDAEFQRKCLGRMKDVATSGRTVLFVSHNMNAVRSLCSRAVILQDGAKIHEGKPEEVVERYHASLVRSAAVPLADRTDREGTGEVRYTAIRFFDGEGRPIDRVPVGEELVVELEFACHRRLSRPRFNLAFLNVLGQVVFHAKTHSAMDTLPDVTEGGTVRCRLPSLNLLPGSYVVRARLNDAVANRVDGVDEAATIEVVTADVCGTGRVPFEQGDLCYMPAEWSTEYR